MIQATYLKKSEFLSVVEFLSVAESCKFNFRDY